MNARVVVAILVGALFVGGTLGEPQYAPPILGSLCALLIFVRLKLYAEPRRMGIRTSWR